MSDTSVAFLARLTLSEHGRELSPFLEAGAQVLHVGGGPGVLSRQIAARVAPGTVMVVDQEIDGPADGSVPANLSVRGGSAYDLSMGDATVDVVFAHGVIDGLERVAQALGEFARVLRPGGHLVVVCVDWTASVVAPESDGLRRALAILTAQLEADGGDPRAGRHLGEHLVAAGFEEVAMTARYECHPDHHLIADYLAEQVEAGAVEGQRAANALRKWADQPAGLFAQCWITAVGRRPGLRS